MLFLKHSLCLEYLGEEEATIETHTKVEFTISISSCPGSLQRLYSRLLLVTALGSISEEQNNGVRNALTRH